MHDACCCPYRTCLTYPSAGVQGEAAALELAAAEMAQAAATLVSIERDIVEMVQNGVSAKLSHRALMMVAACCLGEAQERVACMPAQEQEGAFACSDRLALQARPQLVLPPVREFSS